jgi:soluble lytic murein transglycosylase-like protein
MVVVSRFIGVIAVVLGMATLLVGHGAARSAKKRPGTTLSVAKSKPERHTRRAEALRVKSGRLHLWSAAMSERCRTLEPLVKRLSQASRMDVGLVMGIIRTESGFQSQALSRVGAQGLMQVMESTANGLGCRAVMTPEGNIRCGLRVLVGFLRYYRYNLIYALSGYNAGFRMPNAARKLSRLPANIRYVERVLSARAQYLRYGCQGKPPR